MSFLHPFLLIALPLIAVPIIIHLIQNDFLNEQRFAQSFARGKFRIKKWGRNRIPKNSNLGTSLHTISSRQ